MVKSINVQSVTQKNNQFIYNFKIAPLVKNQLMLNLLIVIV
jgi:hypothetical protein